MSKFEQYLEMLSEETTLAKINKINKEIKELESEKDLSAPDDFSRNQYVKRLKQKLQRLRNQFDKED